MTLPRHTGNASPCTVNTVAGSAGNTSTDLVTFDGPAWKPSHTSPPATRKTAKATTAARTLVTSDLRDPFELCPDKEERDLPHPGRRVADRVSSGDCLRERLRHRVARDLSIAGVRHQRPPQHRPAFSVEDLVTVARHPHARILHHTS